MKKLVLLIVVLVVGSAAIAQDQEAKEVLDRLAQKAKSFTTITADFTITVDNKKDKVRDSQSGRLLIKGAMFKVLLKGSDVYSNGKVRWTHLKEADEVNLQNVNPNDPNILHNPTRIFSSYTSEFKYVYKGDKKEKGVRMQEVHLFPRDLKAAFASVKMKVDSSTGLPTSIVYAGKDGVTYTITFSKIVGDLPISNSDFVFNTKVHPNVEVIDMR